MSQAGYALDVTLTGHTGTITALRFSPDCEFLASGSDHGVLLIFSTSSWRPVKRLVDASPITTIVWHDKERYLLLCGCESGDLHFVNLTKSLVCPTYTRTLVQVIDDPQEIAIESTSSFGGPIRSLSFSPANPTLAVAYGEDISIAKFTFNPYGLNGDYKFLPEPPSHPQLPAGRSPQSVAMSLHFFEERNQLIVTYLNYGIVWVPSSIVVALY